jgi:hypothetical protein
MDDFAKLLAGMLRALAVCSVDSAAAPFAMSAWNKVRDTGRQYVSPEELLDWSRLVKSAVTHVGPGLWAASGGERSGFDAALAFVIEITMRDEADPSAEALRIAEGTLTLDTALRSRELERLSRQVAVEVPPAAPEIPDAAVLARLVAANQLVAGDLAVPVPAGAQTRSTAHPSYIANAEGAIVANFLVPGTVDDAHAFYRGWARRDGWLIELGEPGQVGGLRLARGDRRIALLFIPWLDGIAIHAMLHRTAAATYRLGPDDTPPVVPPVRRPYPLVGERDEIDRPGGDVHDRGLLYVSTRKRVCMVDPTTGTVRVLVGAGHNTGDGPSEFVRLDEPMGLALAGDALWIADAGFGNVRCFDFANDAVWTLIDDLDRPGHLAIADGTLYVQSDRQILAVDTATRARRVLAEGFEGIEGIAVAGSALYVVDHKAFCAVDRTTGAREAIAELPDRPTGIASDGQALYAGCYGGIARIGVAERALEQIAGGPGFCYRGTDDGPFAVAGIGTPTCLAWDGASGLYFWERNRLRWFDLRRRFVVTTVAGSR